MKQKSYSGANPDPFWRFPDNFLCFFLHFPTLHAGRGLPTSHKASGINNNSPWWFLQNKSQTEKHHRLFSKLAKSFAWANEAFFAVFGSFPFPYMHHKLKASNEKSLTTFHYSGWLIGILLIAYDNPHIIG